MQKGKCKCASHAYDDVELAIQLERERVAVLRPGVLLPVHCELDLADTTAYTMLDD
jgi:hypothetical protein